VEKDIQGWAANGVYPTLVMARGAAQPGDTIAIRSNEELVLETFALDQKALQNVTIKAARKSKPALKLAETATARAALFRVHDWRLQLEGLDLRLEGPSEEPANGQATRAAIDLVGNGECLMKDCTVTLIRGEGKADLSLAMVTTASGLVMKSAMPARPPEKGPRLVLTNCLVRGEGDLMACKVSRPFALEVQQSLVALSGSALNVDIGEEKAPEGQVCFTLKQTTTWLGGNVVRMATATDKGPKGVVPVAVDASESLFVPQGTAAMVHLIGGETMMESLKDKFSWKGQENAFGYSSLLARDPGTTDPSPPLGPEKWKAFESESSFGAKFEAMLNRECLPKLKPEDFRPAESFLGKGATLERLPR